MRRFLASSARSYIHFALVVGFFSCWTNLKPIHGQCSSVPENTIVDVQVANIGRHATIGISAYDNDSIIVVWEDDAENDYEVMAARKIWDSEAVEKVHFILD